MVCAFGDARIRRRASQLCTLESIAVVVIAVVVIAGVVIAGVAIVVVSLLSLLSCGGGGVGVKKH